MLLFTYQILFVADFLLFPFFIIIWIKIFKSIRDKRYKGTILYKYYMPGLYARFVGATLSALMYQYYYGYGDTFLYFMGSSDIFVAFVTNPASAIEMLMLDITDWSIETRRNLSFSGFFYKEKEAIVCRIGGLFSLLGLGTYIGISLAITAFSFLGSWCMYLVFYDIYPHLHKQLSYAVLYLPSMCFWSTGLMKDPLVIAGLGFFIYGIYFFGMRSNGRPIFNLFMIGLGIYLTLNIKAYVLGAVAPATVIWFFLMFKNKIKNPLLRKIAGPVMLVVGVGGAAVGIQKMGSALSLDAFLHEAQKMQWWLSLSTDRDGGTGYSLSFEATPLGLLKVFPESVNVALFRPYIWEARKIIVMPSALEALFTLLFTLYVFFKTGLRNVLKSIISEPTVTFCFIFAMFFAFVVGFTSMNFGALARYKIPCLPFYFTGLIIMLSKVQKSPKSSKKLKKAKK